MKKCLLFMIVISLLMLTSCNIFKDKTYIANGIYYPNHPYITVASEKNYCGLYELYQSLTLGDKFYEPTFLEMDNLISTSFTEIKESDAASYKMFKGHEQLSYDIYDGLFYQYASCNKGDTSKGNKREFMIDGRKVFFYDLCETIPNVGYVQTLEATFKIGNDSYYLKVCILNRFINIASKACEFVNENTELGFDLGITKEQLEKEVKLSSLSYDEYSYYSFTKNELVCYVMPFKQNNISNNSLGNIFTTNLYLTKIETTSNEFKLCGITCQNSLTEASIILESNGFTCLDQLKGKYYFYQDSVFVTLFTNSEKITKICVEIK